MTFILSSSSFRHQGPIPRRNTGQGEDLSPPLSWSGIPQGAESLALVIRDPDVPDPDAPERTWIHWIVLNLPPVAARLTQGVDPLDLPNGSRLGWNDWQRTRYGGPMPPRGRHRYIHTLYALDLVLPGHGPLTEPQLCTAMDGHVLETALLVGTYEQN
ncbi:MAG: YbhB/YbcL family Raf kinase inhibitor-like protein [Myxococcota bacterium]|jgi:hypothetical protein|nr:YbhB/YbcL family Raf kinase inhibitor-like protein [Myxococcota bacterium]